MSFLFDEEKHEYTLDGIVLPSVTQIIQEAGLSDYSFVNETVLKAAANFGTAAHLACELEDYKDLDYDSLNPELRPYLNGWNKFKKDTGFICEEIEKRVYSKKYLYAGTLDRVGPLFKRKALVDIKTGTSLPKWIRLQTAGYKIIYNEGLKIKDQIKDRYVVQLLPDDYKLEQHIDKSDTDVFLAALTIRNWKHK